MVSRIFHRLILVGATVGLMVLAGCTTTPVSQPAPKSASKTPSGYPVLPPAGSGRGGYYMDDGPGDNIPEGLLDVPDAEPRIEPYAKRGNNPYVVFGKRYVPMTDERPYKVRGRGSWYGKKFHGQKTSSGELYDMYKMSAAHPTLPIPSYARVTNLSNGKQVIVRVNDRGPFRSERVIDLSYTAALKLGYIGHGSTELEVERLLPADIEQILASKNNRTNTAARVEDNTMLMPNVQTAPLAPVAAASPTASSVPVSTSTDSVVAAQTVMGQPAPPQLASGYYLQFGAYSQAANAEAARMRLTQSTGTLLASLRVESVNNLYRIYSGPFATRDDAVSIAHRVEQEAGVKPFIVQR
ncbi:septal ring lytic transglycosylase RlpA family protein [uncultured Oxalicibacterium sp.]|uniref:septal ring lytic transglycosylase RlpA family protein n=1 Tax=uncultured Oxalicibacterium sp. TaxID=1168540 RepID=UPI0025F1972E|nr:septal ring lytic transglycosylase RlpA family protein [uncultured Oxalicibacterium sp.]